VHFAHPKGNSGSRAASRPGRWKPEGFLPPTAGVYRVILTFENSLSLNETNGPSFTAEWSFPADHGRTPAHRRT